MTNIDEYRKKDVHKLINEIERDCSKYSNLMEEKKRIGKLCTKLDIATTVSGVLITLIFSLLGNDEVVNPKVCIIVMEALFSAVAGLMLLIARVGNLQNKKYYVYEKVKNYSVEQLNSIKILYSEAFEDGEISKYDYEKIIKFKSDYEHKKIFIKSELGNGYTKIEK